MGSILVYSNNQKSQNLSLGGPGYDLKTATGDVASNFPIWSFGECGVTPQISLLPGPLWPGVVVPARVPIMG